MFNLTRRHMIAATAGAPATITTTRIATAQQQSAATSYGDSAQK